MHQFNVSKLHALFEMCRVPSVDCGCVYAFVRLFLFVQRLRLAVVRLTEMCVYQSVCMAQFEVDQWQLQF